MSEFIKDKKKDLLTWIKNCENKFNEGNKEYDEETNDFFRKIYEDSENIRKYFFDNYLHVRVRAFLQAHTFESHRQDSAFEKREGR